MKQKILLLGGSAQQVIAIETAKRMGYYTILCDYLLDNPGQYVADKYYNISTTDVEAVYEVAKRENVEGILAYASDPAALPAAAVAERLGLPANSSKSVEVLGVKHKWRHFLKENNFACPKSLTFRPETTISDLKSATADFKFPILVKPTDSSGSKGVTVLESFEDFEKIFEAIGAATTYSRNKILIAEEYIERGYPYVIGGDIFVWNGEVVLFGEMACLRDESNSPLIPIGKIYPSGLNSFQISQVHTEIQKIVNALNISFGEMNIEILIDKDDKVHFLELGPRAGGNMIPIQLGDIWGIDLVKANIQAAMGVKPDFIGEKLRHTDEVYMHYVLHSYKSGVLKSIEINQKIRGAIYRTVLYKHAGDIVESFDGAGKALGILFLKFSNEEGVHYFCSNHNELIKVVLDD